jgi:mannose-6-phosphate isomerase-like protein (cupin superfamily)
LEKIDEHLLEVRSYEGEGYQPLIDYDQWRVAILRYCDELLPHRIFAMQRHNETDEVFVLLEGRCILFLGEGKETITSITSIDLEPRKVYNVRRGVWHSHTLNSEASVLIVENCNTTIQNSPKKLLSDEQRRRIVDLTHDLWQA